jgi:hypothetical protein
MRLADLLASFSSVGIQASVPSQRSIHPGDARGYGHRDSHLEIESQLTLGIGCVSDPRTSTDLADRLFYSYSHKDETLRNELEAALSILKREKLIAQWHDRRIGADDKWKGAIDERLEEAHVILLLGVASQGRGLFSGGGGG